MSFRDKTISWQVKTFNQSTEVDLDEASASSVVFDDIVHEIGPDFSSDPISHIYQIPASKRPTKVKVVSRVASASAQNMRSPQYMATLRRRFASSIAGLIRALAGEAARDDFEMAIHPVVEKVRGAITTLQDAEQEGNSREILRQLRDSMLDGQWERFKHEVARHAALRVLSILEREDVTADDIFDSADALEELELNVFNPVLGDVDQSSEVHR